MPCQDSCIVDPFAGPCPDKLIAAIAIGKLPKGVWAQNAGRQQTDPSFGQTFTDSYCIQWYSHDIHQNC